MSYYAKHAIWVEEGEDDLTTLRDLIFEQSEFRFDIGTSVVFDDNGDAVERVCINDFGWNCGCGVTWYDFESDMRNVSEHFADSCPDKLIKAYVIDENGYEVSYEFINGRMIDSSKVVHYREKIDEVRNGLNALELSPYDLPCIRKVSGCPVITFRYGAFVMVGFNVFELVRVKNKFVFGTKELGDCAFHYEALTDRAEAMKMFYDCLVTFRKKGELMKWS